MYVGRWSGQSLPGTLDSPRRVTTMTHVAKLAGAKESGCSFWTDALWDGMGLAGKMCVFFFFSFFLFPSSQKRKKSSCVHEQTDGQGKGDECSEMNAGHINLFEQGQAGAGWRSCEDGLACTLSTSAYRRQIASDGLHVICTWNARGRVTSASEVLEEAVVLRAQQIYHVIHT